MLTIEAPDIAPVRGGLLQHANVVPAQGHYFIDGIQYQTEFLTPPQPIPTDGSDKEFERNEDLLKGNPFTIYKGVDESLFRQSETEAKVEKAFERGEGYAVERALQTVLLNPLAVDITPTAGTAIPVKHALAVIEQYAGANYAGLPLIHASRFGTAIAAGELEVGDDWTLHTKQGTPFANGAGYTAEGPGGVTATGTQFWMYVTGQVNLFQGELATTSAHALQQNRALALVERSYIPTVERFVAAVLTTL